MTAFFARLRDETAMEHGCLEQQLDLMSDSLTASRYRDVLQAFYGYVGPYESQLAANAPPAFADAIATRRRAHLLHADLLALGLDHATIDTLPRADALPAVQSLPALLGCMYVMEGSTLGGRVIGPHIEQQLGLSDGRGYSYFLGHGAATGRLWTAFRHDMDQALAEHQHDEAINAARAAFHALTLWFAAAIEPQKQAA
jgi:heme oxygenase